MKNTDEFLKIEFIYNYMNKEYIKHIKSLNPNFIKKMEISPETIIINFISDNGKIEYYVIEKETDKHKISKKIINGCCYYVTKEEFDRIYKIITE